MTLSKEESYCRVCGLYQGVEGVRTQSGRATYFICDCCGSEFGNDDKEENIKECRKKWLYEKDAKWCYPKAQPENWSLCEQLKNIPNKFQDEWLKKL